MPRQFEYDYQGPALDFPSLTAMVPGARTGQVLIASGLALFFVAFVLIQAGKRPRLATLLSLLSPCVLALGMFVLSQRFIDELFINLKHPWNLYHNGRFSFSSQEMIDGTVEIFYYSLLTPFAWSHRSLLLANYVLGMLITLGHVSLCWLLLAELKPLGRLFGAAFFALDGQILWILSSGFGNGLVSLAVLFCLWLQYRERYRSSLVVAALLPLVRIDAVVLGAIVLWADWRLRKRLPILAALGMVLSLLAVFGLTRILYGHWMLTPALFKSNIDTSYFLSLNRKEVVSIFTRMFAPFLLISLVLLPFALLFARTERLMGILKYYAPPALLLLIAITCTTNSMAAVWFAERYVLSSCVILIIPAIWLAARTLAQVAPVGVSRSIVLVPLVLLPLILSWRLGFVLVSHPTSVPFGRRIDYLSSGGIILDRLLPRDWTVAAHEVDSVGYFTDRPILDLWGYTNRDIATSRKRNKVLVKSNCHYFQTVRPDVLWLATEDKATLNDDQSILKGLDREGPEEFYPNLNNIGWLCQAGDLVELIDTYTPFVLRNRDRVTVLFVRNDRVPAFRAALAGEGYGLAREREFSRQKFEESYHILQPDGCS